MAQLESGKKYIIENIGIKNYIDLNGSGHTVAEYFTWLSEKIAIGLDIEMQPIIKENNKCFLPLPYINKPTNNRLCLYIGGESLSNIAPKIGYFNGQDYYIESTDELPRIMYNNQNSFIVINDGAYSRAPTAKNFLDEDTTGTFVIDTNFLDTYGFYNIAFLANAGCDSSQNQHITEAYASPRVFICDMFNVLTEQHYDGAFTLANSKTDSSLYVGGYVLNNNFGYNQLDYLSTAAIGIDKDGKYCVQGFLPQVFTSDYNNEEIISASMIRIQFGKLKTYYPMYITLGNAIENLINYCDSTNVWGTKGNKTWYKDAFKIDNKKFTISCSCDKTTFSLNNPQWAVVIEDKEENKPKAKGYIEVINAGSYTITFSMSNKVWEGIIEYSLDEGKTWATWSKKDPETRVVLKGGKNVYLRGTGNTRMSSMESDGCFHTSDNFTKIRVRGNMEALLDYKTVQKGKHPPMKEWCFHQFFRLVGYALIEAPDLPAIKLSKHCYDRTFNGCYLLEKAPTLPAIELVDNCYADMFLDCSSLKEAPELPSTILASYCYSGMFNGCRSLTQTPELPATILVNYCYSSMFSRCTSLKKVSKISATILENYCCRNMFYGCTSLEEVPKLLATTLAKYCYQSMFNGCTSLKEAPELPAMKMEERCYDSMFKSCNSLKEVPDLPATTLATYCYNDMFVGCTSLTETHKVLPATTLANSCYHSMYYNCSSITKTYKDLLPATTLTENCYRSMFSGCSSLKNVPKLPATTLANYCYYYMFVYCSSLEEVCELPATALKNYCYNNMFRNCSKIKLSTSKTGIYTNSYRIPSAGSGTNASSALNVMFTGTGGSFAGAPNINQTYYTSNKVV